MKMLARAALLLLACLAVPAMAQTPDGLIVVAPAGFVPSQALCLKGTDGKAICPPALPVTGAAGAVADVAGAGSINAATLNAAYTVPVANGQNTVTFVMSGLTASGATLVLEGSNDGGATWTRVFSPSGSTGIATDTFTADGSFSANVAARTRVRLRVSVVGTGAVSLASNLSVAVREVRLDAPLPPGQNTIGSVLSTYDAAYTYAPLGGLSDSSIAASYSFTAASQTAARAWYGTCPAGTISAASPNGVLVTATGVNGGTKATWLTDGNNGPFAERIVGFTGNTAGCTIGVEF